MGTGSKTGYRYFFLSFAIAFFALTIFLLFLILVAPPTAKKSNAIEAYEYDETAYTPNREDSITVLFISASGQNDPEARFLLARFDPVGQKVPITVLPYQTAVRNSGQLEALGEIYRYGGAEYTRQALAAFLGIDIQRYVRLDADSFLGCAKIIGSVEYTLSGPMTIDNGGVPLVLEPGLQLLDGHKASGLLSSADFADSQAKDAFLGELTAAIVNQRIDVCQSDLIDKIFAAIVNLVDTDINQMDYQQRKEAAQHLSRLAGEPAFYLEPAGSRDNPAGLYVLTDSFGAYLRQVFS